MSKGAPLYIVSFLCFATMASAAPITYDVTVDTSSILGTMGSLDFEFNPGPLVTQAASLQILNFTSNGILAGSPVLTGDVMGALPGTLTFDNGTAFNDYFEGFTYGSTLSFQVSLFGPALSSPNGTATSGSTFAFSMFSDLAGTMPVLTTNPGGTNPGGFAFTIDVNLDGSTTVDNLSVVLPSGQQAVVITTIAVPEPSSLVLLTTIFALGTLCLRRCARG